MKLKKEEMISLDSANKDKYEISNLELDKLKNIQDNINQINDKLKSQKINFKEYNKEILKIEENLPNNYYIIMDETHKLNISFKAKLKLDLMTKDQLKEELLKNQKIDTKYAYYISWTESECGWGQRPDGITIYKSVEDGKKHIKKHWDSMPKELPNEYSRPNFEEAKLVEISQSLYKALQLKEVIHISINDEKSLKNYDEYNKLKKIKP